MPRLVLRLYPLSFVSCFKRLEGETHSIIPPEPDEPPGLLLSPLKLLLRLASLGNRNAFARFSPHLIIMMAAADGDYLRFLIENKLLFYPLFVQHDTSSCRGGLRVQRQQHIGLSGTAAVGASSLPLRNERAAAARGVDIAATSSGSSHRPDDSMNAERLLLAMMRGATPSGGGIAPDSSSAFTWPLPATAQRRWAEEPRKRQRESEPVVQPRHKSCRVTCMLMEASGHSGAPQRNSLIPELPQRASHASQLPERASHASQLPQMAPLVSETPQRAFIPTSTNNNRPHSNSTGLLPRPRRCWTQQGEAHAQLSQGSAAALLDVQRACGLRRWERWWVSHRPSVPTALAEVRATRSAATRCAGGGASPHGQDLLADVAAAAAAQSWDGQLLAEVGATRSAGAGGAGGAGGGGGASPQGQDLLADVAAAAGAQSWDGQLLAEIMGVGDGAGERSRGGSEGSGGSGGQQGSRGSEGRAGGWPICLKSNGECGAASAPAAAGLSSQSAAAGLSSQSAAAGTPDPSNSPPARPATVTSLARNPGSARSPAGGSVDLSLRLGPSLEREETEAEGKETAGGNDEGSAGGAEEKEGVSIPGYHMYGPYAGECTSFDVGSDKSPLSPLSPQSLQSLLSPGSPQLLESAFAAASCDPVSRPKAGGPVEQLLGHSFTAPAHARGLETPQQPSSRAPVVAGGMQRRSSAFTLPAVPEGYALAHGGTWACEFANAAAAATAAAATTATAAAPDADPEAGASMGVQGGYALARDSIWACESAPAAAAGGPGEGISRGESRGTSVYEHQALLYKLNLDRHMSGEGRMRGEGEMPVAFQWD
ncbi:unnamed protein product [Closterium sp. NIES-65]|nr:unnamed protein product [Closterium sp. NIES-65]